MTDMDFSAGRLARQIGASEEVIAFAEGLGPLAAGEAAAFYARPEAFIAEAKRREDYPAYMLGFYLRLAAVEGRERFLAKGLTERIFQGTMRDLALWSEAYAYRTGKIGLADSEIDWMIPHMSAGIVTLGRLQFKPNRLGGPLSIPGGETFDAGAPLLEVHIPRGGPMSEEAVEASFSAAADMFSSPMLYRCDSWLLSPALAELLPPTSNILRFARRFWIERADPNNDAGNFYVRFMAALSGPTRLSEGADRLARSGRNLGTALGWLVR